jgi:O-antigen/teichoic acid export membrane protein
VNSKPRRELVGRAGWNIADQVVSSGTNLVLSLLVARSLSAEGFGAFAVAFTVYSFLIGAGRALIAQPLIVRYLSRGDRPLYDAVRSATAAAAILGLVSGALTVVAGLIVGGDTGQSLIAIGVVLPGLLLQDMWRAAFIATGRPAAAFINDVLWGVVQLVAVGVLILTGQQSAPALILGWGGAALIAAIVAGFQFGGHPHFRSSPSWVAAQRDLLGYYAASFASVLGANQLTMLLIAGIGSPSDVGALRAAQVVLGPLNLVGYSLSAFALPEVARRQSSGSAALKIAIGISAVMVVADLVWGGILVFLPSSIGTALLGDSWANAQAVLPASLLGLAAIGLGLGATVLMTARGFAKESFRINALLAPGFLILGVGGLLWGGAQGAALGLSLAQVIVVPVLWTRIIVLMRRERGSASVPASEAAAP